MKSFPELNRTAQFRRLAALARCAILDYGLGEVSLSPLQHIQNAIWNVQCRGGQRYVLRIHAPRRHDTATIRSELLWLQALSDVFGLIHADLIFSNVMFHRGEAHPIDFDDCGFGYFLYDMAILLDRIEMREDYAALRAALLEGYRQIRPLAAEHEAYLNLFVLARWVFLGVCFLSRPEFSAYAPRFLGIVEPKVERYMRAAKSG